MRCAWLTLAICLVIFTGPFKRLIELKLDHTVPTAITVDKKLKTWYREKRDNIPQIHFASQPSPETGFTFLLVTALVSFLSVLSARETLKPHPVLQPAANKLPLYLHIRRMRI